MSSFQRQGSDAERWASIRADGKRAYVIRFMARFVPLMVVLVLLARLVIDPLAVGDAVPASLQSSHIIQAGAVGIVVGWVAAAWTWRDNERKYATASTEGSGA